MNPRKICIEPLKTEENQVDCHRHNRQWEKFSATGRVKKDRSSDKSRRKHNESAEYVLKDISGRVNTLQDYNSISTTSSNPKSNDLHSQYSQNQAKIEKLREKLSQLYSHYKTQRGSLFEMQSRIDSVSKLKAQNASISEEIGRIKNMVKEALLNRQKNRLTARKS